MGNTTKRFKINKKISEAMTKLTPDVVKKLEEAFAIDASVEEACYYVNVSRTTFYNWMKANPELFNTLERLRNRPVLKARQTVAIKLGESYQNAMDYLKRKKKLEFGDAVDVTSGGKDLTLLQTNISKILNERKNEAISERAVQE